MTSTSSSSSSKPSSSSPASSSSESKFLFGLVWAGAGAYALFFFLQNAYKIRLQAIEEFGPVIHEFDPYFNYRATEYLYEHGAKKFFTWFDYKVWYPLGRPVGTTIYPGMQFTAVFLKNQIIGDRMSLNDICCYMPAWFGALASFLVGMIVYECSLPQNTGNTVFSVFMDTLRAKPINDAAPLRKSTNIIFGLSTPAMECGLFATGMMSIVPAHLMRSIGGGFDNESVAITALALTFYLWVRGLRVGEQYSFTFGALAGVAYFYMVAAWGGYVFVLNLIGFHAAVLVIMGRFSTKVYANYTLFYLIGTSLAVQVPVVGWAPVKSLEQLGPCAVFLGFQLLQFCEVVKRRNNLTRGGAWKLRIQVFLIAGIVGISLVYVLAPSGYFGPISSRVRGLFVKHTKTGNPLVDSVAEHQPASNRAYLQYLHHLCFIAPIGFLFVMFRFGDSPSFLVVYACTAFFFSNKMVRLILLTGPIASSLGGIAMGRMFAWAILMIWGDEQPDDNTKDSVDDASHSNKKSEKKKKSKKPPATTSGLSGFKSVQDSIAKASSSKEALYVKRAIAVALLLCSFMGARIFSDYCWNLSKSLSNPTIILKGQLRSGETVFVDDYREAYWWIRDNTPEDSRVMAWWDYGYQITAIANRTTIADGNTWNHEHIALLGKILTSSVDDGYSIARHLADFVLVWGGGGGDDLAKSPHLARIANSVYRDHCPGDPTCRAFGFVDRQGTPSSMMRESFLYNLHSHQLRPGVEADPDMFREVYRSRYGKVRVYEILGVSQESKEWVADPVNRKCDVPGSWFCPGDYPPAIRKVLERKKDFAQLEDFNRGNSDSEYQKQYFENLKHPDEARRKAAAMEERNKQMKQPQDSDSNNGKTNAKLPSQEEIDAIYNKWEDSDDATLMYKIISSNSIVDLEYWLKKNPLIAFIRSSDGRGPMWWAFEHRNQDMVKMLMKVGVSHTDKDKYGKTPVDLLDSSN